MGPKIKIVFLIVVILISIFSAGAGFYLYQKEHLRNIDLENKLNDLTVKQKATEEKLAEAQKSLSLLESQLKDTSSQIDSLSSQLQQEKAAKEEALAKIDQMKSELDQQKESRLDLEKKLNSSQDDVRTIKASLSKIESEKSTLESKIKELEAKANVELGKIVVSPEAAQPAVQAQKSEPAPVQNLEGKVLVLNKEYNFVVVNLGNKDGVAVGDVFGVYHGDKYLGDVKVEKVQEIMSAAGCVSPDVKNKVKEGDKVVRKGK